jgi:hypothetical protein
MDKHPADEFREDLAADRFYGERTWNLLEREPFASHNLDRRGQMLPLEIPWLKDRSSTGRAATSSRGAMRGFWFTALGISIGAFVGVRFVGILGLIPGAFLGAWLVARLAQRD